MLKNRELQVVDRLGSGAFGDAFLVHDRRGNQFVVKRSRESHKESYVREEALTMKELSSDHTVRLYDIWLEPNDERLYMLLEYCCAGDLEQYLEKKYPLHESELMSIFVQLLIGLDHIHLKHKLHRDIKLANILLHREKGNSALKVKIGDFGLSKTVSHTDAPAGTRLGTPLYFSPELISGKEYTRKTDIWSMGVVFYSLMTRQMPFAAKNMDDLTHSILRQIPAHPSKKEHYSTQLGDLVMTMLTKSRTRRPDTRALLSSNLFADVLNRIPWLPPMSEGIIGLFACRPEANINIRAAPSLSARKIGVLHYGDQIYASRSVAAAPGPMLWFKIVYPFTGYCIVGKGPKCFFQVFQNPEHVSPLTSPIVQQLPSTCSIDISTICPRLSTRDIE